jgi:ABC-type glycerol-3-phosphate transport system substrate-binding protein
MRAMQRRAQKHFKRLQKLRDKGKMANLSDQQIWDMTRNTFAPNAEIQALEGPIYDDDDDEDEDEYEDDTPEDDEEAVEFYGGIYGGGLFIHGRGFQTREFKHGRGFQTRDKKKSFQF